MTVHALETSSPSAWRRAPIWLALTAVAWVSGILWLAAAGVFDVPPSKPALPTIIAITLPVGLFAAAMIASPRLRALALAIDPVLLVELQAWRILGGIFLVIYAFGILPGLFALPAGFGDVAVGVAAPFVAWRLRSMPGFLASPRLRLFHYLGLLDFAIAVAAGLAARGSIPGLVGDVTAAPMGELPLVLIPALAVPAFIIAHLIALMQIHAGQR